MFESIFLAVLLAGAISIDAMMCAFGYGSAQKKISLPKIVVISLFGALFLGVSLFFGYILSSVISEDLTIVISMAILIALGLYRIIKRPKVEDKHTNLSWRETFLLAFALSIDGLAVGFGAGIHGVTLLFCIMTTAVTMVMGFSLTIAGYKIGRKLTKKTTLDLTWVSGVVLILLGLSKLVL